MLLLILSVWGVFFSACNPDFFPISPSRFSISTPIPWYCVLQYPSQMIEEIKAVPNLSVSHSNSHWLASYGRNGVAALVLRAVTPQPRRIGPSNHYRSIQRGRFGLPATFQHFWLLVVGMLLQQRGMLVVSCHHHCATVIWHDFFKLPPWRHHCHNGGIFFKSVTSSNHVWCCCRSSRLVVIQL